MRWIYATGLLQLTLLTSYAQPTSSQIVCTANAGVPPIVRGEGLAELVGDIVLTCAGGVANTVTLVNFQVSLNTRVTSRRLGSESLTSEALLLINEPAPSAQSIGSNVFRGAPSEGGSATLLWPQVPIMAPGTNGTLVIRFTNIRANAQEIGTGTLVPTQIMAVVVASGSQLVAIENPQQTVAFVQSSRVVTLRACNGSELTVPTLSAANGANVDLARDGTGAGAMQLGIRFQEGFASAFKVRISPQQQQSVPGTVFHSESGYMNTSVLGADTGRADAGTRLRVQFSAVPPNVRLFVTTGAVSAASSSSLSANLIIADPSGAGASTPATAQATGVCPASSATAPIAEVAIVSGIGTAVWEIAGSDPAVTEQVTFGVVVAYAAGAAPASSLPVSYDVQLAPVSTISASSVTAPIPRFGANTELEASPAFNIGETSGPPSITTTSPLPPASLALPYALVLAAAAGAPPYYWSAIGTGVPPGLQIDGAGRVAGTPTTIGNYSFPVRVLDTLGQSANRTFALPVSSPAMLSAFPASLGFAVAQGSTTTQTIVVDSTGAPLTFNARTTTSSGGNWLSVTPLTGVTRTQLAVTATASGLIPGAYVGSVIVSASTGSSVAIPVSMSVVAGPLPLSASPSVLSFTYTRGSNLPAPQFVSVVSSGAPADFATTVTTSAGGQWLAVTPAGGRTPASLSVTAAPQALSPGRYDGVIAIQQSPGGPSAALVRVTLVVQSPQPALIVPRVVSFSFDSSGPPPPPQTYSVTSRTGGEIPFVATPVVVSPRGMNWLRVTQSRGTTPATITLSADPSSVGLGRFVAYVVYSRTPAVQIVNRHDQSTSDPPQSTVADLESTRTGPFAAIPRDLSFNGNGPESASVNLVNLAGAVRFNATASPPPPDNTPGWLSVAPTADLTPRTLTVSTMPSGLDAGRHEGRVAIQDLLGSPNGESIRAVLTTTGNNLRLGVETGALNFDYQTGGSLPPPASVSVSSTGGELQFTSSVREGSWLSVSPASGRTPQAITISVNPAGLQPGVYPGSILVSSPDAANSSEAVSITLTVATSPASNPSVTSVVNGASFAPGPVAPGSLITLSGTNLSDGTSQASTVPLPLSLNSTSVTINGTPAPLLYVSGSQINAQLPWNVLPEGVASGTATVVVTRSGRTSQSFGLQVSRISPGVFSTNFGSGNAIAINIDRSLAAPLNSVAGLATRPAAVGSVIQLLGTGLGRVNPAAATGSNSIDAVRPVETMPVVTIGGRPAQILFAGMSPEFVGVNQLNVVVPDVEPGDAIPVQVQADGVTTSDRITIAVTR